MRLRKSLSQSLKKSVRKVKVALQIKKVKNEGKYYLNFILELLY